MNYSHTRTIINKYADCWLSNEFRIDKYQKDKKLDVYYLVSVRYKNNSKKIDESNTEALYMFFDENRSTDFTHTELDIATGESYTVALIESHQPTYGNTCLVFRINHVDKQQQLHETQHTHYCKTPPGTIGKRLQHYHTEFIQQVQELVNDYQKQGHSTSTQDKMMAFAAYIYLNAKKHNKTFKDGGYAAVSEYAEKSSINKILVIYSALNGDCFQDNFSYQNFDLSRWPLELCEEDIRDFSITSLGLDDSNHLDAIMEYLSIDYYTVHDMFIDSKTSNGGCNYDKLALKLRDAISIQSMEVQ